MTNRHTPDDLDFMSELEAINRLQPAWHAHVLLYTIVALLAFILIWAGLSEIEVITRGEGQVVPSREIQVVQSLEGGILAELNVQEGDRVTKGQVIARIEDIAFSSQERGIEAQTLSLQLKKARLRSEINQEKFIIPDDLKAKNAKLAANEMALYDARMEELSQAQGKADEAVRKSEANIKEVNAVINRLSESKKLLSQQLDITRNLVAKNAMPKLEAIKQEREYTEIQGELNAAYQRRKGFEADLAAAKNARGEVTARFQSQALTELADVEMRLAALKESLTAAGDKVERAALKAPVDGIVKTINQKTIGGIVEPAMRLVEIVPMDDDLKITAKIAPADIAFLEVGQPVNVKITAYDAQKFGSLKGKVTRISADTIEDKEGNIFFEIDVVTEKNYLGTQANPMPIIPGMVAQTEVITGERTILSYMAKPFLRVRDKALTEQ